MHTQKFQIFFRIFFEILKPKMAILKQNNKRWELKTKQNKLRRFIQENGLGDHLTVSQVEREIFSQVFLSKKTNKNYRFLSKIAIIMCKK